MSKKKRPANNVWVDRDIIKSAAVLSLSGTALKVYLLFILRRQMEKNSITGWTILNDGEIVFTYAQARKLGFSSASFQRAIDQLLEVGLIEIARPGNGLRRLPTLYGFSNRWRDFGRPGFEERQRRRDLRHTGFCRKHKGAPPPGKEYKSTPIQKARDEKAVQTTAQPVSCSGQGASAEKPRRVDHSENGAMDSPQSEPSVPTAERQDFQERSEE